MTTQTENARLDLLLNSIEENCTSEELAPRSIQFQIDCLNLISSVIPQSVESAFQTAVTYTPDQTPARLVVEAAESCWMVLDDSYPGKDVDTRDVSAIRALIFTLKAIQSWDDDFVTAMSFFLTLINNVERHIAEEEALLKKHFDRCLRQ